MRILIAEDEPSQRQAMQLALAAWGHECSVASDGLEAEELVRRGGWDVLISDLRMPGLDGMEVLRRARAIDPSISVLIVTGHGTVDSAVAAMREGADDYLQKPFGLPELRMRLDRVIRERKLADENVSLRREIGGRYNLDSARPIVGASAGMKKVEEQIRSLGRIPATVLITGESGTGKDLVARAIHYSGVRREGPFVALNCSSISRSLLESQLFGHVKGAFTGAVADAPGFFVAAEGGTLFLDEITEIDTGTQAKLLRTLQEKQVVPVGSTEPRAIDVRIIAATNRDLDDALSSGALREDLYYRINVVSVHLPPLRERADDIPLLARHFARKVASDYGLAEREISEEAMELLSAHSWPGNVRELQNVIERAFALGEGPRITAKDLPAEVTGQGRPRPSTGRFQPVPPRTLDEAEREAVTRAVAAAGGNKSAAADRLGIDRKRLYRLMRKHGVPGAEGP